MKILNILKKWLKNNSFDAQDLEYVLLERDNYWDLREKDAIIYLKKKINLFLLIYPDFVSLCDRLGLMNLDQNLLDFWCLWLPLALQLAEKQDNFKGTFIQGILGGQGTGKTTLTAILQLILSFLNKKTLCISLDDLYKTYEERKFLRRENPFLIWRGPPGTHDVNLGLDILFRLHQNDFSEGILVPRFDKSLHGGLGDRIGFESVEKPDICLFEGWFVGVYPVDDCRFDDPPWPIVSSEDRSFALFCNHQLKAYLPLWQELDSLMILYPEDYRWSKQWRKDAEHGMMASGKTGMSDGEVEEFVEYFWRSLHPKIFITPLLASADVVISVGEVRTLKIIR
jgi:D-glycerate 3-kinase